MTIRRFFWLWWRNILLWYCRRCMIYYLAQYRDARRHYRHWVYRGYSVWEMDWPASKKRRKKKS